MLVVVAALSVAGAVFALVFSLATGGTPSQVGNRLSRLDRNDPVGRHEQLALPFTARVVTPGLRRLRSMLGALLPGSLVSLAQRKLLIAGEPVSVHAFLTIQAIAAILGAASLIYGLAASSSGMGVMVVIALSAMIALAPIYWLRLRIAGRRNAIVKALPDAVDLLVTTVEAGMAIDAALAEIGAETSGPLGEELRLTVRETTLGRGRREALLRLVDRTDVPELKTFVQALTQAEQTGIPIGQVLRTQAAQIRLKKRQRAEAEAQRAPVKMVVVLVLLVLPSMLMMVMGPALIRMADRV